MGTCPHFTEQEGGGFGWPSLEVSGPDKATCLSAKPAPEHPALPAGGSQSERPVRWVGWGGSTEGALGGSPPFPPTLPACPSLSQLLGLGWVPPAKLLACSVLQPLPCWRLTALLQALLHRLPRRDGSFKSCSLALAGVAQWVECRPVNQRVTSLIPSQGTCLGY
ncbi:hypothetical protein HJG60_009149 [Phyllostomus discolor]|uniref:Uncharacterized protein n=1 Tax=Phyllostomus discolor TaxID=89673 RepID=A0A833YFL7_9CHIR|nr:hypothetical protein HJG60_009149 [Phyllostomus discolor]